MHQFHFFIPDPESFPSGGNVYNLELIKALARNGVHVSQSPWRPEQISDSPDTQYLLDSIYFAQVTRPPEQIPRNCVGLIHHLESLSSWSSEYFEEKERRLLDRFTGFLVTSSFTRDFLEHKGYRREMITVIEPAPMTVRVARTVSAKVHALILGSCVPRKNQQAFLEALADTGVGPFFTLTIAGSLGTDPGYALRCQELILGNPCLNKCVRLLGEQQPDAIPQLYQQANLFISASTMETFGMAIQDAVVSGLPVLVSTGGYAAEHVADGVNGFRCRTAAELATQFVRCVSDTRHFMDMQERALAFKHPYHTWADAAEAFIRAYSG